MTQLASGGLPLLQVLDCLHTWPASEAIRLDPTHPVLKARQEAVWAAERFSRQGPGQPHGAGLTRIVDALRFQRQPGAPLDDEAALCTPPTWPRQAWPHPEREQQALWPPAVWQRAQPRLRTGAIELLSLYDATARRDWPAVQQAAERILGGGVDPTGTRAALSQGLGRRA